MTSPISVSTQPPSILSMAVNTTGVCWLGNTRGRE